MSGSPGFFWTILWFLIAIGPLIFIHEMGHFLAARACGVKVEAFSIGFGREIIGWSDKKGTRWKVGWMPLGGYVRFAGDWDAASQSDGSWKELPPEERTQIFHGKPVWQRAFIVAAGPIANFIAAIILFMALFAIVGQRVSPPVVNAVSPGSAAAAAGFQKGDRIKAIDGREIDEFNQITDYIRLRAGQVISFSMERNGAPIMIDAAPRAEVFVSRFGTKAEFGLLGIASAPLTLTKPAWYALPGAAVTATVATVRSMVDGLGRIIMGYISVKELGGPVMMAKMSGEIATMGWEPFIMFVAAISINLGFINLLPVPMLDGGHLLFCSIEALQRKPVSAMAQEWAYRFGFALVMGFMVMVTFNDIMRFGWLSRFGDLIG